MGDEMTKQKMVSRAQEGDSASSHDATCGAVKIAEPWLEATPQAPTGSCCGLCKSWKSCPMSPPFSRRWVYRPPTRPRVGHTGGCDEKQGKVEASGGSSARGVVLDAVGVSVVWADLGG